VLRDRIDPIRRAAAHRARDRVLVVSSNHLGRRLFAEVGKTELRVDDVLSAPCGQSKTSARRGSVGPRGRFDIWGRPTRATAPGRLR